MNTLQSFLSRAVFPHTAALQTLFEVTESRLLPPHVSRF